MESELSDRIDPSLSGGDEGAGQKDHSAVWPPLEASGVTPGAVRRTKLYRSDYRKILRIAVAEAVAILLLIGVLYFIIETHHPEDRYFVRTEDGVQIEMQALLYPNVSSKALTSWSAQAATEVMTFGYNNYRRRLQEASRNFTKNGWLGFIKGLDQSKLIQTVEQNRQVLSAAPAGPPVLVSQGVYKGRYQWEVEVPLVITYQAGSALQPDFSLIKLVLVPVQEIEGSSGVAIEEWTKLQ